MKFFFGVAVVAILYSCHRDNVSYDKPYFDFDSLVHVQVHKIASEKTRLLKHTSLNGKVDSSEFIPDTVHWKHEFDAFQQLDVINKPLFKGNYLFKKKDDDHSNLAVHSYSTTMKSPVPEVKFFYQDGSKLKRIESAFNESNVLYSTSRKLTLEFEEQHGLAMISHYRVTGFQKMILSDSVKFSIEGKLQYP